MGPRWSQQPLVELDGSMCCRRPRRLAISRDSLDAFKLGTSHKLDPSNHAIKSKCLRLTSGNGSHKAAIGRQVQ
jgi:hypothetical protein